MTIPTARPLSFIRVTHTGVYANGRPNTGHVFINDLDVGYENQLRKAPCYVPVGGFIDIPATSRAIYSYDQGAISKFIVAGVIHAKMYFAPETYTSGTLPAASGYPAGSMVWLTDQLVPAFSTGSAWVSGSSGGSSQVTPLTTGTYTASPNTIYAGDVTSGNIVINVPVLTLGQKFTVIAAAGNYATNSITVNATSPQQFAQPPPNNTSPPISTFILGGPSSSSGGGVLDAGTSLSWIFGGVGNTLLLFND